MKPQIRATSLLLGTLAMTAALPADAHDATTTSRAPLPELPTRITRPLTDFTVSTPDLGWTVVNDGVMGGRSKGTFRKQDAHLRFTGRTNTDGGGFSSIRTGRLSLDLGTFDGVRLRVKGDGRRYTWRLVTDARWQGREVAFWADFPTKKDAWTDVEIPFSRFTARWRGRELEDIRLDPAKVRGMGLMIYDGKDGQFALELSAVHAYRSPFRLRSLEWTHRLLVVYAPTSVDPTLARLRKAVAEQRAAFDDRDMRLIVVSGRRTAPTLGRAGDIELTRFESRHVLADANITGDGFAIRLIGKDGGVKRSATSFDGLQPYFDQIDTMPMRRREMREKD